MKKSILKKLFTFLTLVSFSFLLASCGSSDDDAKPSVSGKAAGTFKGTLSWMKGDVIFSEVSDVVIKVTDLGNNKVKIESASDNYKFTSKEFSVWEVQKIITTATSDAAIASLLLTTTSNPYQIEYAYSFNGESVVFSGVKQ